MSAPLAVLAATGSNSPTWSDDVFSSFVYTGNGSTQTITNGIDLAGKGGLVWIKSRSAVINHNLLDTARGVNKTLYSSATAAQSTDTDTVNSFGSTGFTLGAGTSTGGSNTNTSTYTSWTFRKAAKFFDVVTFTTDASGGGTFNHSLGISPGMVLIKSTAINQSWVVYHAALGGSQGLTLNTTSAAWTAAGWATATSTSFTMAAGTVTASQTYVAYLFAHDTTTDGLIQCGSFTTDGSGNATVALGWEPQFVLMKVSSTTGNWQLADVMRGMSQTQINQIVPNTSAAEGSVTGNYWFPTATGFTLASGWGAASSTYIYLAIRRPNKPPTTGAQVYNAIARTGTGAAATVTGVGFAPDLGITSDRDAAAHGGVSGTTGVFVDKLRGGDAYLISRTTGAEGGGVAISFGNDGVSYAGADLNFSPYTYINHFFKRAPGVFDVVCYTGDGTNPRSISHSLGVAPQLKIIKRRSAGTTTPWATNVLGNILTLNETASAYATGKTVGTATTFEAAGDGVFATSVFNESSQTYVAYLFATKAGISYVGSYTGNGSSQTINCGFTTGARFVMIKRTDSTGDWYVWDSTRGIIAANDPHLSLNTTAAEVTTNDSIDPDNSGFIVNQLAATNINVNTATYIYLAFA